MRKSTWKEQISTAVKRTTRNAIWTILLPLHRIFVRARGDRPTQAPKRILLINGAHLGDVIISTSVLPVLRSAFPDVEIGFAAGSWAHEVIEDHPEIEFTHRIDDWRRIRTRVSIWQKWKECRRTRAQFLREIRDLQYDWAIALYWRPDFFDLVWRAGIPVRAAYRQRIEAFLATHLAPSRQYDFFVPEGARHEGLLRALGIEERHIRMRKGCLAPSDQGALSEVKTLFPGQNACLPDFCIVHMGAGSSVREMATSFWREVTKSLSLRKVVVFTGQSERENTNIRTVMEGMSNCINACGSLSWKGFVAALRHASEVYSVDTAAAHAAAAVGTPTTVVSTGINGTGRWHPEGAKVTVWTNHVFCSPCFRSNGCRQMECLTGIRPDEVVGAAGVRGTLIAGSSIENTVAGIEGGAKH